MQTNKAVVRNVKINVNDFEDNLMIAGSREYVCFWRVANFQSPEYFAACGALIILICYASEHRTSGTPALNLRGPTSQKSELGRGKPHHLLEYCEEYRSGEGGGWRSRKENVNGDRLH